MSVAKEPCLYYYLKFLVKEKGKLNMMTINEAQKLWDKLCSVYQIENNTPRLFETIQKLNDDIFLDKSVKRLATIKTVDNQALGGQILAHDMLILCIVLNTPKNYITDSPERDWERQFGINSLVKEFDGIYSQATVLQTMTDYPQQVADLIQKNLSGYKNEPKKSTTLQFGKLWKFGAQYKYLLTTDKENEEAANKFLANNFAYILTILSKIETHYLLAVKIYKDISKQEEIVIELENTFKNILLVDELTFLKEKREEIKAISKESTHNLTYLRDCGNNIQSNIINLKDAIKDFILYPENDKIFTNNLELYEEHLQNINSWVIVCESSLMRIDKAIRDMEIDLDKKVEKLRTKIGMKEIIQTTSFVTKPEKQISIEWGNSYIINENELEKSLNIFRIILEQGKPGLCITRTHPDKIRRDCKFENATIKWLSKEASDFSIAPILERISHTIIDFFKDNPQSVLLLDGLEYIKTNNNFNAILKFTDHLKDLTFIYKNTLLLPTSFTIFPENEITLIKKNMIEITDAKIDVKSLIQ